MMQALAVVVLMGSHGQSSTHDITIRVAQIIPDAIKNDAKALSGVQGQCLGSWEVALAEQPQFFSCSLPGCSLLSGADQSLWDPTLPAVVGPRGLPEGTYIFRLQLTSCPTALINQDWFHNKTGPEGTPQALAVVSAADARLHARYRIFAPEVEAYTAGGFLWSNMRIEQVFRVPLDRDNSSTSLPKTCGLDADPRCTFRNPEICLGTWVGCGSIDGSACNATGDGEAASRCPGADDSPPRGAEGPAAPAPGRCHGIAREICPHRCSRVCMAALAQMDSNPAGCASRRPWSHSCAA
jgi:hypothetical protein